MKRVLSLTFLLCLILSAPALHAGATYYLYQPGVETEIDVAKFTANGEILSNNGVGFAGSQKVTPGTAPAPYPAVYVWEKAIEQLGPTDNQSDGVRFINGNLWVPQKKELVLWTVRIPQAYLRLASEFDQEFTLSLWVDWNQDRMWGKRERMLAQNIDLSSYFPTDQDYLEFQYLTWFRIPYDSDFIDLGDKGETSGAPKAAKRLWVRCAVTYCDPDKSPDGEALFGEVEDYQITYFNNKEQQKFTE